MALTQSVAIVRLGESAHGWRGGGRRSARQAHRLLHRPGDVVGVDGRGGGGVHAGIQVHAGEQRTTGRGDCGDPVVLRSKLGACDWVVVAAASSFQNRDAEVTLGVGAHPHCGLGEEVLMQGE